MPKRIVYTSALHHTWLWAGLVGAYSSLTLLKGHVAFTCFLDLPVEIDAAIGFALGMLIALRVNRAYERWWEARTLWGTLVNVSRNLAIKVRQLVQPPDGGEEARLLLVAYCHALKDHLRGQADLRSIPGFATVDDRPGHVPSYLVSRIYALFSAWQKTGHLDDTKLWVLDREARVLLDVCGGCERIKNTLMSVSWRVFTRQCIGLYLLVLPWGRVDDFGFWTIPLSAIMAYMALGGEGIASYIEEPFGISDDHLDLESICQGIQVTVNEILAPD